MDIKSIAMNQAQTTIGERDNKVKNTGQEVQTANKVERNFINTSKQKEEKSIKEKMMIAAIEEASGKMEATSKGLEFCIHEKTNQIMIKVIDTETNEVLKELPSEKILDMVAKFLELSGSFIDEKR